MSTHKFRDTDKLLTRFFKGMNKKQQSHEKTARLRVEKIESDKNENTNKLEIISSDEQNEQIKKLTSKIYFFSRRK